MIFTELGLEGVHLVEPKVFGDARGAFLELFVGGRLTEATGRTMDVAQVNCSVSRRGTIRGIHLTAAPPGEAKYVTCVSGSVVDVVVDVRVGSPTYGKSVAVPLDDERRHAVYIPAGFGHGFAAVSETAVVTYLCDRVYTPHQAISINPLDPRLALPWPAMDDIVLSDKDRDAPTLAETEALGVLPDHAALRAQVPAGSRG
ncbi:dTDP-4-dehydrorhamnose 3,5-epimerase [Streptomyces nitrosporeus]|uniref:dTDP-4-dehydrorhamnose 3,5-epimerase n=1 Tax=Streptomyces nitrosporeus TaxID=28894 RepID=A0A5J6FBT2_9ACTN|nr:dTDP-4-dehydrorhamnose 3,5-epimerase [Streptomyces nitrosporeus]QEU73959.1 dTDP-4-dehydrorhamnose 3,5-epimerase [Streptomyces nitrosporeus]GGZ00937.1 dTDP-4-dehydrorhamnose 3,5-epimerase [Streptomyces nitrosporeus]